MADLSTLSYGTVQGRFVAIVGDAGDGGVNPDAVPMVGTVTITPSIQYALVAGATPVATTALLRPIVATLDANGDMVWNGSTVITLLATDSVYINPTGWTYQASFQLTLNGEPVAYGPFSFQVAAGSAVDLTLVAPVASSSGTLTIVGPAGPTGPAGPSGGVWGSITGTLSSQADLAVALGAKAAVVHNHDASEIISGTIATARLGSGVADATKVLLGNSTWAAAPTHTHPASDIASGTIATARLGTGTADNTVFLRGDGTWAAPPGGGAGAWGSITGTLSDQTDLQSALDGKVDESLVDAKGDVVTATADNTPARLAVGTNDHVLTADSAQSTGLKWAAPNDPSKIALSLVDAKGDLIVATAADTVTRLAAGANDFVLTADSAQSTGLKWAAASGSMADLFPRKAGQYYTTTHPLSGTNVDANVFGTSGTRVFLIPFAVTHTHSIDRLGINVTTAGGASSVLRLGVYPHAAAWGTVSKVVSGSVAADSTGDKTATVSQSLAVGMYWLAIGTTDTAGTLVVRRASALGGWPGPMGGGINYSTEWALQYDSITLTTDLPSTIDLGAASSWATNDVPLMWVRKA